MIFNPYQVFDFPPEWSSGVSMKYAFNTSVYVTEHYKEQRKPLRLRPWVEMNYNVLVDHTAPRAIDFLRAALNSILYVPIWTEVPKILGGERYEPLSVDILTEDTSDFFCLNHLVNMVILIDRIGARASTVMKIHALTANKISVIFNSVDEWTIDNNTLVYPARLMILDSMRKISFTPSLEEVQVGFKDYVDGLTVDLFEA